MQLTNKIACYITNYIIICFFYDQNIKTIFKLLISVVDDRRKEIGSNSHVEI